MADRGTLAFTDPEELQELIDDYFQSRWATRKFTQRQNGETVTVEEQYMRPPTMAGLALALGVTRVTLLHYGKGKGERDNGFIPVIARAKERIAEFAEEALYSRDASRGASFALAVNHGYGKEDQQGGTGEGFNMVVIPPAQSETALAIPKWEPEGGLDGD